MGNTFASTMQKFNLSCGDCRLKSICLPLSLKVEEIDKFNEIIQRERPIQKNAYLYRANDQFDSIFAVRSGFIKTTSITKDGIEQVTGFFVPGEILGMDGIGKGRYTNSAIALETASICEIPFSKLETLSATLPNLQHHFFQLMGKVIIQDQHLISLLSIKTADQRVATFLLCLSERFHRLRLSPTEFQLPMTRADIGSYLGLTIETVSRIFSGFQKQGLIDVNKREIKINDLCKLHELCEAAKI